MSWTPVVVAAADEVLASGCDALDEDVVSVWVCVAGVDAIAVEGCSLPVVTGGSWEASV
ncbi:hypothetical protein [Nocardia sp. NPDC004604]|uniref:hypothetical protein n=1 Tax=Nocardia sp. NPDC004604 TaxID=3157013 RepID=UPI0033B072F1